MVFLKEKVIQKIQATCKKIDIIEWQGFIYYTKEKAGSFNLETGDFTILDMLPVSIGTYGGVTYSVDNNSLDQLEYALKHFKKEVEDGTLQIGMIHSHHEMAAYMSNIDMNDLTKFINLYKDGYLSIVVNNRLEFAGGFAGTKDVEIQKTEQQDVEIKQTWLQKLFHCKPRYEIETKIKRKKVKKDFLAKLENKDFVWKMPTKKLVDIQFNLVLKKLLNEN